MELPALTPATLIRRYKRFLADVTLADGTVTTVHCPNPGSMMGLKDPGRPVWLSTSTNPKRKLAQTLELVDIDGTLVAINTNNPNKLAEEAIRGGTIAELQGWQNLRREVPYGENSRIDVLLEGAGGERTYVEVKNCHLIRTPGLAEFPDSVTTRGAKHLRELARMVSEGHRAVMLFIVQYPTATRFATAPDLDPAYHQGLLQAAEAGVEVLIYRCHIDLKAITVTNRIPWQSPQQTQGQSAGQN
ncbi:MAG: DNA/RNA nuclease SfsA [Pseudomonadota bacterium]